MGIFLLLFDTCKPSENKFGFYEFYFAEGSAKVALISMQND